MWKCLRFPMHRQMSALPLALYFGNYEKTGEALFMNEEKQEKIGRFVKIGLFVMSTDGVL